MGFPTTETGLKQQGYRFSGAGVCKSCESAIAWYETPKGKAIPLDEGTLLPHWTTCAKADEFRDKAVDEPKTGRLSSKTDGYRGPKPSTFDVAVLLRKIEHARTMNELILYGEEAKTAPERDKPVLREMYTVRLRQLKAMEP